MKITLIAAMGTNRVIGGNGKLPWQMPDDQARFHALTLGKPTLVGRKTFTQEGAPLPGRTNLILSRSPAPMPGAEVFTTLTDALHRAESLGPELMVIGGGEIYALALSIATDICLTIIEFAPEGDTLFPEFEASEWSVIREQSFPADQNNPHPCTMRDFARRPTSDPATV